MVYNEQFIAYGNRSAFDADLAKGKIKETSIVFIEDTKLIWTLGTIYSCPFTAEEIQRFLDTKVDKVTGKSLLADSEIEKLAGLPNSTELTNSIATAKAAGDNAQSDLNAHKQNKSNPHEVTKAQVGLGNVDNTSDANKPVSTAQATAIADAKKELKAELLGDVDSKLVTKVDKVEGKDLSTNDYTDTDKAKLTALPTATELNTELEDNIDDAVLKSLIAEATAAGAVYNNKTGYFELNGLVDITEAQMRIILRNTQRPPFNVFSSTSQRASLRTNLWEASPQSTHDVTIQSKGVFSGWLAAEVLNLNNGGTDLFATKINGYDTFKACMELHTILGDFSFGNGATTGDTFASCFKLRSFRLYGVNYDIDLHWSPLIAVESLQYLVTNAANTSSITVTVHPDVYAKLTGDTTNAAAAALTAEELAQWQALVTTANSKNISFATTSN